ncbi:hypothetical protein Clacol_000740 [Clathrus columnatus]|uniref:Uncharacterized protein n=1 Tax=Clathrus columnatus TaxID=1419009 RepID=A0AAV5A033_9AGAM|nr:hypothetical protein Clacol_000740 [Clathrus columnatus]
MSQHLTAVENGLTVINNRPTHTNNRLANIDHHLKAVNELAIEAAVLSASEPST